MSLERLAAGLLAPGVVEDAGVVADAPFPGLPPRGRPAAVLALFSTGPDPELLFTERAATLRRHAGQVSFPGGRLEAADPTAEDAALREAAEEVGLDPRGVDVLGRLPGTRLSRAFNTTVVVGAWSGEQPLQADPGEVAQVLRYPLERLESSEVRVMTPTSRGQGPAFVLDDIVIWGFTAHLTDRLLELGGWARPWDRTRVVTIPERFLRD